MTAARWMALCAFGGAVACSYAPEPAEPAADELATAPIPSAATARPRGSPAPELRVEPQDRFTRTADTRPAVILLDSRVELADAEVRSIAERCRLVSLRDSRAVEVDVSYEPPNVEHGDVAHRIEFVPRTPLRAEWYAFEVDMRSRAEYRVQAGLLEVAPGVYRVRFRPDSHPVVRSARVRSGSEPGTSELELVLSERVFASTTDFQVFSLGERIDCGLGTVFGDAEVEGSAGPSLGGAFADQRIPQDRLTLACAGELRGDARVELGPGVATIDGLGVYGPDDATPAELEWALEDGGGTSGSATEDQLVEFSIAESEAAQAP